jgi:hypothetical protein
MQTENDVRGEVDKICFIYQQLFWPAGNMGMPYSIITISSGLSVREPGTE